MSKKKEPTFEDRLRRLQAIVTTLESGERPLEESVALYKEGLEHTVACRKQLAQARHEIEVCSEGVLTPYEARPEDASGDGDDCR